MALIKCSECGKEVSSSAKTCPHCGMKLSFKKCPECGKKLKGDETNCPECGFPLEKKTATNLITENLDKITGAKSENYVTVKDLFKDTFKKHTDEDIDSVFVCGTEQTTPKIKDINPKKASAWVYFKMLIFFLIAYIPTYVGYIYYGNSNFLPAMIILAAFAIPVTVLVFFFEINLFRNLPFHKVLKYFIIGGGASLFVAILYYSLPFLEQKTATLNFEGAFFVSLVEEVAKIVVIAFFLFRNKKCNYILNGLLVGAAVGAGFGAFETAGYILRYGMKNGIETMLQVIKFRGLLAPGMHVAWATIEGGALMYVKGFDKLDKKHLNDKRFLLICIIPLVLHWFWDLPIQAPFELFRVGLTVAAWVVIIYFINLGLKQIDDAKKLEKEQVKK